MTDRIARTPPEPGPLPWWGWRLGTTISPVWEYDPRRLSNRRFVGVRVVRFLAGPKNWHPAGLIVFTAAGRSGRNRLDLGTGTN